MLFFCVPGSRGAASRRAISPSSCLVRGGLLWECKAPQFEGCMWMGCLRPPPPLRSYSLLATSPAGVRQARRDDGLPACFFLCSLEPRPEVCCWFTLRSTLRCCPL